MKRRHINKNLASPVVAQLESPPPPKRRRVTHLQAGQESFYHQTRQAKAVSHRHQFPHSRADSSSDHPRLCTPQLHAPSLEFNPSLPLLDPPPVSNSPQSPGDALTEASSLFVDNVLLNLHVRTHRTTDQSDDKDFEDALEGDTVEAADSVDHETDEWNGEDVAMEGDADSREGIVSDWDLLGKEFIVEAEELGKFENSLFHSS